MANNAEIDSLSDIVISCKEDMLMHIRNENPFPINAIPIGYYKMDDILDGFRPGELITVGGVTSIGKSAFVLNILHNVAIDNSIPALLFTAEMNSKQICNRLTSIHCRIPYYSLQDGRLSEVDWMHYDQTIEKIYRAPLYIENTHHLYIEDVIRVAENAVNEKGVKLIVIDYLQMMYYKTPMNDNRYVEINSIICQLKSLAMELQVPIIVTSQLNRKISTRDRGYYDEKIPQLTDLRDSGTIGDDSDVVMFVYRPEYYHIYQDEQGNDLHGMAQIIIAKNRFGTTGTVQLSFKSDYLLFQDPEDNDTVLPPEGDFSGSAFNDVDPFAGSPLF